MEFYSLGQIAKTVIFRKNSTKIWRYEFLREHTSLQSAAMITIGANK